MDETKPVLMLAKVLKVPPSGESNFTDTPKYKLLPLDEVVLYPAVSRQRAALEYLALTKDLTQEK